MRPVIVFVVLLTAAAPARADLTREQVLGAYRELEQKLGASPGDPSTALATFMVGCHAAYSGAPFPEDAHFAALRQQVKPQVDAFASIAGSERAKIIE